MSKIEARQAGAKGLGVFAVETIQAGDLIEKAPALVLNREETALIRQTMLKTYYFEWDDDTGAVALGCGCLYNHSFEPNADYFRDYKAREIHFFAVREIQPGEEILINYNGFVDDASAVAFEVIA